MDRLNSAVAARSATPRFRLRAALAVLASSVLVSVLVPLPAEAQYFGRNQVTWQVFDWRVARTDNFNVHYYPEQERAAFDGARMAERWNARLTRLFAHQLTERKPFIFYANHPDFQQTNVVGGPINEGVGGLTEAARNRVVLPFTGVYADNDHVIGHELVHVYQYELAQRGVAGGMAGMARMPLWQIEGMAEYFSIGRVSPHTAMWMRDAAMRERLPTMDQLGRDPRLFPYRYGHAAWAFIGGTYGDTAVALLYRAALRSNWGNAVRAVLRISSDSLSNAWIAASRATFLPQLEGRTRPGETGAPVIVSSRDRNLGPSVSPDGNLVAFFSTRELFDINIFLADARTGRVIRRLGDPNRDSHFDAISFIASAGTWSPDAERVAFVIFARGNNEVAIWNVRRNVIEQRFNGANVGAISTLSWSPDGNSIVFSGTEGGISNLYLRDLRAGQTRQLTDDRHAQLHPNWSPDGRTIAYATDQGPGTDFQSLTYSPMRLALMDVASGQTRLLTVFEGAKHINPQFSPDGRSLYFISNRGGISDIYRHVIETGETFQVTRVMTGITGISELSPAFSVARETGRLLYSVFEDGREHIFGLEANEAQGTAVTGPNEITAAGTLPPLAPVGQRVDAMIADAGTGLPVETEFPTQPYRRRLGLEYIGPPQLGVGADQFGVGLAGAAAFYFADMLGDYRAVIGVQAMGSLRDIGGQLFALNARRRLNWGGGIARTPYIGGFTQQRPAEIDGQQGVVVERVTQRVFVDQAQGIAHYPFSTTQRAEFNVSATRLSYHQEAEQYFFLGQQLVGQQRSRIPSPDPISYGQGSAALVGDWSFFGFTSPVVGGRYRLELSQTFGAVNFQSALLDYRRYLFFRPLTFAVRGIHFGRYGSGAEDERVGQIFVGMPNLIRGYDVGTFRVEECGPAFNITQECPPFDRLVGSRIGVLNAELRIPVVGAAGLGLIQGGMLPIEVAPFFDAGIAWRRGDDPRLEWTTGADPGRVPVFSAGVSTRVNLFGAFVLEVFYARPFQRPLRSSVWGWQLQPGW